MERRLVAAGTSRGVSTRFKSFPPLEGMKGGSHPLTCKVAGQSCSTGVRHKQEMVTDHASEVICRCWQYQQ